jgi:hypothetical protein
VKLKVSTKCLIERPAVGYKRHTDRSSPEQSRSELIQTEELVELAELRGEIQPDCGRLSKK